MSDLPTWVFVAGTYRTASTTQYLIARDVVEETKSGLGVGYHTEKKLEEFDVEESGRFVVCKIFLYLPEKSPHGKRFLKEKRTKALCTIRDPRDVIVSMKTRAEGRKPNGKKDDEWNFQKTATENFPVWLGQLEQWIDLGPETTMVSRFEDFTANLFGEVKRIAAHLEIDLPKDLAHDIAKRYTIAAQQETKRKFFERKKEDEKLREDKWLPSIPGVKFGTSGTWRTWLSTSEAKMVVEANRHFFERFYPGALT
jgi:hypothetical protein